jgi:hypothetical protein
MDAKVKDEAVDQLAALQTAEALDVLAAHITYVSVQQGFKTPLVKSRFIEMGEKSVPTLLRVIDSSSDPKVLSMAVPALVLIKGTNYHRFCWEIADKFPASVLQKLNHYAVVE